MIVQKNLQQWLDSDGNELVRLDNDRVALVSAKFAGPAMLRDLSEACSAAADALELIAETKAQEQPA
jgi:hypothetical protein